MCIAYWCIFSIAIQECLEIAQNIVDNHHEPSADLFDGMVSCLSMLWAAYGNCLQTWQLPESKGQTTQSDKLIPSLLCMHTPRACEIQICHTIPHC